MDSSEVDYSSAEMPSGVVNQQLQAAFDKSLFEKQANDPEMSLQVLANCVTLVNSTILRERMMLPDDYFHPFTVYGDIQGYMLDQTHPQAKKVVNKMNTIDVGIRGRRVYKVAIVVEKEVNAQPTESFVWNFSYGEGVAAQLGYNGNKALFNVSYKDMQSTCRQFCDLFKGLQTILKELLPLPVGLIPSLKVAYKGDCEFCVGFQQVDEFVNMEQIGVGVVAFPYQHKFHISYASDFIAGNRRYSPEPVEVDHMQNTRDIFDYPDTPSGKSPEPTSFTAPVAKSFAAPSAASTMCFVTSPAATTLANVTEKTKSPDYSGSPMEITRVQEDGSEKTVGQDPENSGHEISVFEDLEIDDGLMSATRTHGGELIVEPEAMFPPEAHEFFQMDDDAMDVDGIYGNLEKSPEREVEVILEIKEEVQFERASAKNLKKEELVKFNRRSGRLGSAKKQQEKVKTPPAKKETKKKSTAETKKKDDSGMKNKKRDAEHEEMEVEEPSPVPQKKSSARRLAPVLEPPVPKKNIRMPSLLDIGSAESIEEDVEPEKVQRYGRISSIRSDASSNRRENRSLESPVLAEEPEIRQEIRETPKASNRYGRTSGFKGLFAKSQSPPPPKRYGMARSIKIAREAEA